MKKILIEPNIASVTMPENVRVGLMVSEYRIKCKSMGCPFDYLAFAFGQSPLPLPKVLSQALIKNADKGHYSDANGVFELREAIAGFNERHFGLKVSPDDIFVGPGTKGVVHIIFNILQGDVIIPSASWIGYSPIANLLEKPVHVLPTELKNDYKIEAKQLETFLKKAKAKQHLLIINSPNNPTGAVYSKKELEAIATVCRKYNTYVLADEIYALTTYKMSDFTSMGTVYPEGTFTLNGIAKDRSAGGYRVGYTIFPTNCHDELRAEFKKVAATMYTNIPTPIQYAAITAYKPNKEIEEYFDTARKLHQLIGQYMSQEVGKIKGLRVTKPKGGFYFFVDFNDVKKNLKRKGVKTSNQLAEFLIGHP